MREYREANQALVTLAHSDLRSFWGALNFSTAPPILRETILSFIAELVSVYGDAAALLGADWYDMLRDVPPSSASFRAALSAPVGVEQSRQSARWALGTLFGEKGDPWATLLNLEGVTQRLILQPGRDSVWDAARRDPVRTRFARLPQGATTCRWCVMLASRGAVYASEDTAGQMNRFHDNCDCVIMPARSRDDLPDGHDLAMYERLYREGVGLGRDLD